MRLIDADEATERAISAAKKCIPDRNGEVLVPVETIASFISTCETVDAQPVTRCIDCKYYDNQKEECRIFRLSPNKFFFCSCGRRF